MDTHTRVYAMDAHMNVRYGYTHVSMCYGCTHVIVCTMAPVVVREQLEGVSSPSTM